MHPPYRRIADEIRARIATGELQPGDKVPSARQITQEWGVAIGTATKVLTALQQDGVARAVPGVGTVVNSPEPGPARRKPREPDHTLTQERVVRTAIEIADHDGLAALSMRRVATDLGVATMSLYRYVQNKDDLVVLMTDAAFAERALPDPAPHGWRARLEAAARMQWAVYRAHPWVPAAIPLTRPRVSPAILAQTEWALRSLIGVGLGFTDVMHVHITMFSYVRGTAINIEAEAEAAQNSGTSIDEWMTTLEPQLERLAESGEYPTFMRVVRQDQDFDLDLDELFEFGLRRMLDGLALLIDQP